VQRLKNRLINTSPVITYSYGLLRLNAGDGTMNPLICERNPTRGPQVRALLDMEALQTILFRQT